jgi:hypothetical protein
LNQLQSFDVLVLDVFSSDAIPVHLLTVEAFRLYLRHLKPDGLLLLHITNLNLDLEPVVDRLAGRLGLNTVTLDDEGDPAIGLRSKWMLVTRNSDILGNAAIARRIAPPRQLDPPAPLWTDDYTSLLPVLR